MVPRSAPTDEPYRGLCSLRASATISFDFLSFQARTSDRGAGADSTGGQTSQRHKGKAYGFDF
jgi:hypothetical protein